MSYTRHNWIDPETINAAKLNNIEDGIEEAAQSGEGANVANVFIDGEVSGSSYASTVIYRDRVGTQVKAILSSFDDPATTIVMTGYCKKAVRAIPLGLPEGFSIGIAFPEYSFVNYDIETSGGIAQSYVVGVERTAEDQYISVPYYIYEVTGSGTITVTPK